MKCNQFLKEAQQNGWWLLRQAKGSHELWTNGEITVIIPNHGSKELPKGLERSLRKKMGLL